MTDEAINEAMKKILPPSNVSQLRPMETNELVLQKLRNSSIAMELEKRLYRILCIFLKGLIPITHVCDALLRKEVDNPIKMGRKLLESIKLLCTINVKMNVNRRLTHKLFLKPSYQPLCDKDVPFSAYLYGDDVVDVLNRKHREINMDEKLSNVDLTKGSSGKGGQSQHKFPGHKSNYSSNNNNNKQGSYVGSYKKNQSSNHNHYGGRFQPYQQKRGYSTNNNFSANNKGSNNNNSNYNGRNYTGNSNQRSDNNQQWHKQQGPRRR